MALIVPESISSTASQGEQILYRIFRDKLPDDFLVYYKQTVLSSHLDFIIFAPNFGILLIEVISWYASQIISVDNHNIKVSSYQKPNKAIEIHKSLPNLDVIERRTRKRSSQPKEERDIHQSLVTS